MSEWGQEKIDFELTHLRLFQPRTFSILLNYFSSTETGSEEREKLKQKSPSWHSLEDCRILVFSSHRIDRKMDIDDIMSSCFVSSRNFLLPSTTIAFLWFILRVMRTYWDVKVKIWQHRKCPLFYVSANKWKNMKNRWQIYAYLWHLSVLCGFNMWKSSSLNNWLKIVTLREWKIQNFHHRHHQFSSWFFRYCNCSFLWWQLAISRLMARKPQKLCEIENYCQKLKQKFAKRHRNS